MIKRTVTYTDFNGNEQKEDLYFHFTKTEISRLEAEDPPFSERLRATAADGSYAKILAMMEFVIANGYGVRSEDGQRFSKNADQTEEFKETAAYDQLLNDLIDEAAGENGNPQTFLNFLRGMFPTGLISNEDVERSLEEAQKTDDRD